MSRAYISYLDPFRGLAILLVMVSHIPLSMEWNILLRDGTVFFVFIAGFLMAHLYHEKESVVAFGLKKIKRITLPYLIAALPGVAYLLFNGYGEFDTWVVIRSLASGVGFRNDSLWFAPFIMLVFALYPLWRILMRYPPVLAKLAIGSMILSLFTFRSAGNANPLVSVMHFGPLFMVGMAVGVYRVPLEKFGAKHFTFLCIGSIVVVAVCLWKAIHANEPTVPTDWARPLFAVDFSLAARVAMLPPIILCLKRLVDTGWKFTPLNILAKYSFGLFFWHGYILSISLTHLPNWNQGAGLSLLSYLFGQLGLMLLILLPALYLARKIIGPKSVMITGY
jgi:peptidoglycan/LPS O-acetylase OafA/YrhL